MPGQTLPFSVAYNELKTIGPTAFTPASIAVDNPTPFYLHFLDAGYGAWVNPLTRGAVIPAPTAQRFIRVSARDVPPPGNAGVIPTTTLVASCLIYEDAQSPSPGVPITANINWYQAADTWSPAAVTPTDISTISGSQSKLVQLVRLRLEGVSTNGGLQSVRLLKRTSANSGGTLAQVTSLALDSNSPASTVQVLTYTANAASLGTLAGQLGFRAIWCPTPTTLGPQSDQEWTFPGAQPVILHANEFVAVAIQSGGSPLTGLSLYIEYTWAEI